MNIDLGKLGESELIELNSRIVERLRLLRQAKAQMAMLQFNIGDRVSFQADSGDFICGTLVRHNKRSVTIRADDGAQWRVSPGFLRSARDVGGSVPSSATVVQLPRRTREKPRVP